MRVKKREQLYIIKASWQSTAVVLKIVAKDYNAAVSKAERECKGCSKLELIEVRDK